MIKLQQILKYYPNPTEPRWNGIIEQIRDLQLWIEKAILMEDNFYRIMHLKPFDSIHILSYHHHHNYWN